jgi:hypothetical protein
MQSTCGYPDTTSGLPCENPVSGAEDHCAAGHPVEFEGPGPRTGAPSQASAPGAPFEAEDLVAPASSTTPPAKPGEGGRWEDYPGARYYDLQKRPLKNGVRLARTSGWNGNGFGTSGSVVAISPDGIVIGLYPTGSKSAGEPWMSADGVRSNGRSGGLYWRRDYRWHHHGRPNAYREYFGPSALEKWKADLAEFEFEFEEKEGAA